MKVLAWILALVTIVFSQITIDYNAQKTIPYQNINGYGHNAFYYEQTPAYQELHRIFAAQKHKVYPVKYWRFLNILSYRHNDNGTLMDYSEKIGGRPYDTERYPGNHFDFTKVFRVFDEITQSHVEFTPLIEWGFMPVCMAQEQYVGSFGEAICSPPKSYDEWENVIFQTTDALVQRYGMAKVNSWRWGVWNEPNYNVFWKFSEWGYDGFIRLFDIGAEAMRGAGLNPILGGPDNTDVWAYSQQFVTHTKSGINYATGNVGSPVSAFSIHKYSMNPRVIIRDGWEMMRDVVNIYGKTDAEKHEIWITECAPSGDSWNEPYTQNEFAATWWLSLIDISYEAADAQNNAWYLPKMALYHGDIRQMTYRSIAITTADNNSTYTLKTPLMNVWEMMAYLSPTRLKVNGCDYPAGTTDVTNFANLAPDQMRAMATKSNNSVEIIVYHFNTGNRLVYNETDDGNPPPQSYGVYYTNRPNHSTTLQVNNIPFSQAKVSKYVIDGDHSNVFAYYFRKNKTGNYTTLNQYDDLEKTSETTQALTGGRYSDNITLQENSAMLIIIENTGGTIPDPILAPRNLKFMN